MEVLLPLIFMGFVPGMFLLVILVVVFAHKRDRAHLEGLIGYALDTGWYRFGPPAPRPVDSDARSRRTRLALARRLGESEVWTVWHRWTESSGENSSTTRHRTFYYLWLGPSFPNVEVVRRTSIGAFFKPVRGVGTGDPEFDKRFVVKPTDRPEILAAVTPAVRHAMLKGYVWQWRISEGTLIQSYDEALRLEALQPRAEAIAYLAHLITGR